MRSNPRTLKFEIVVERVAPAPCEDDICIRLTLSDARRLHNALTRVFPDPNNGVFKRRLITELEKVRVFGRDLNV